MPSKSILTGYDLKHILSQPLSIDFNYSVPNIMLTLLNSKPTFNLMTKLQ